MDLCAPDCYCNSYLGSSDLKTTVKDLLSKFDTDTDSDCAAFVRSVTASSYSDSKSAGDILRVLFGALLKSADSRPFIPVLAYRLTRCNSDDINVVYHFFRTWGSLSMASQDDLYQSNLLYYLIEFSELWETPELPHKAMVEPFTNSMMGSEIFTMVDTYCAFSKENSSACAERDVNSPTAPAIIYTKDKYWNTAAEISSQASVLLINDKLDPQTPCKCATYLFEALECDNKKLITFDYATNGTLWSTPLYTGSTCGMNMLASYVKNGGDLSLIGKSCMAEANTITFKVDYR